METARKMNVLVLGASGAGKSTLIKAISGTEVITGVGEGNTQKISVYESETWPIRFIDTKGFEYNIIEQLKTIRQVKKYTKGQITNEQGEDLGIDAVWYCVEGTARRMFTNNIELMNKSIKGWKNIPVFAVITKSYSEIDIPENIEAINKAFSKAKNVNLKGIIPIVAEEYHINDEVSVEPKNIDELCVSTLNCMDEAKEIAKENLDRMVLEQKRYTANAVTAGAATTAAVVGAVPFEFADAVLLVPLETSLTKGIFKIYGVDFSGQLISGIVGSAMITNIAKSILKVATDKIPVAGAVLNGTVAAVIVEALGQAIIAASEAIYKGQLDPEKIDMVVDYIGNKVKESKYVGSTVTYLEENADKLQGKKPKDLFTAIKGTIEDTVAKEKLENE